RRQRFGSAGKYVSCIHGYRLYHRRRDTQLWGEASMHPFVSQVPLYYSMWIFAAVVLVGAGIEMAKRSGYSSQQSAVALITAALTIAIGSKLLYLLESRFYPLDDYVPMSIRGSLHGFRIPGGILALALTTPPVCRRLGLPAREFGDRLIPLAALGLVFV